MKTFLFILTFVLLKQCFCQNISSYLDSTIEVDKNNVPLNKNTYYFPTSFFPRYQFSGEQLDSTSILVSKFYDFFDEDTLDGNDTAYGYSTPIPNTVDSLYLNWFSEQLYALKEPLLFNQISYKKTFRFTWLRTFDNPISIRIEKDEEKIQLYAKIGSGAAGYEPKEIKKSKTKTLKISDWKKFEDLIEEYNFWNQQNFKGFPSTDGSHWILEGRTPNRYHVYNLKSPSAESEFHKLCKYLIDLSGIRVKKGRLY